MASIKVKDKEIGTVADAFDAMEGAGVLIRRALPSRAVSREEVDPFLLLDDAMIPVGDKDSPGFPMHPHRGFEIVTYFLSGAAGHTDDQGNQQVVKAGGLQKITAGSGIRHGEMPVPGQREPTRALQMWINLAKKDKGLKPEYQILNSEDIPEIEKDGALVRLLAGEGSKAKLHTPALYLDVNVPADGEFTWEVPSEYQGFIYLLSGEGKFGAQGTEAGEYQILSLGKGELIRVKAAASGVRFLLGAGKPHKEPVYWDGPFVD